MMKHIIVTILCAGMAFTAIGCGVEAQSSSNVEAEVITDSDVENTVEAETEEVVEEAPVDTPWEVFTDQALEGQIYNSAFYSDTFGVAVGFSGLVEYTKDGGVTWEDACNASYCRFGLDIVNENVVYTCGNAGHITKSVDGGLSFERVESFGGSEPNQCKMMSFCDEDNGIAASAKAVGLTTDGGATWTNITIPTEVSGICMESPDTFYLISNDFNVYKTTDSGATWTSSPLALPENDDYFKETQNFAMHVDGENAYTIYCIQKSTKQLKSYSTTDNWSTCTENPMPDIAMFATLYINKTGDVLTMNNAIKTTVTALIRR